MLETNIHPTAIISPKATLEEDVKVGPYSLIAEDVHVGRGTVIGSTCSNREMDNHR